MAGDLKYNVSCCFDVKITDNSGYIFYLLTELPISSESSKLTRLASSPATSQDPLLVKQVMSTLNILRFIHYA